jgi:hypothetical protein
MRNHHNSLVSAITNAAALATIAMTIRQSRIREMTLFMKSALPIEHVGPTGAGRRRVEGCAD